MEVGFLFACLIPFFLQFLIPITCLMSVFLVFLRMSIDRELIAMKACGLSLYQFLPAPAAFCLLCAGLNLYISLFGLSLGMSGFKEAVLGYAQTKAQLILQPGIFNRDFPGLTLFAEQVNSAQGEIKNVMVIDETKPPHRTIILAPSGQIRTDPDAGRLLFSLGQGQMYLQENGQINNLSFQSYLVRLELGLLFKDTDIGNVRPKEMSWEGLSQAIADPQSKTIDDGAFYRKILAEQQKRWVLPVACLVMGLFAVPLACAFEGMRQKYAAMFAFLLIMLYYALFSIGMNLGETGTLDPRYGLWIPNALFLILGAAGLHMAAREHFIRLGPLISSLGRKALKKFSRGRK